MRVRRGPPPPPPPQTQPLASYRGPAGLGARQAEILARLRRQGEGTAGRSSGRGSRGRPGGISVSELVTPFEEAMDEAYDRLLGRQRRRQRDEPDELGEEPEEHAGTEGRPGGRATMMAFRPTRWRA